MTKRAVAAAAIFAVGTSGALGDFTPIQGSGLWGEPTLPQIMSNLYGGTFVTMGDGVSQSNGVVTATRVHDFNAAIGLLQIDGSNHTSVTDNVWSDGTVQVQIKAAYTALHNTVGWYDNTGSPNTFLPLLTNIPGSSTVVSLSANFEWGLKTQIPLVGNSFVSSNKNDNGGNEDHFITYRVDGPGFTRWLIAAEDFRFGGGWDFNDAVFEVEIVPLPPAAWGGVACLAGLMAVRLRRKD